VRTAAHPGLYDPNEESPALHGIRCEQCETTFFPPFGIGCEVCGATESALLPALLRTTGVLYSVATVHRYSGSDIAAPFTMAEVLLDEGPLIRATLVDEVDASLIGARVQGDWIEVAGDQTFELRFSVLAS
jgi:uncharacterized OB-fold protein